MCSIAGKANLEKSDLEPALKALKDRLMTKNVARISTQHSTELFFFSFSSVYLNGYLLGSLLSQDCLHSMSLVG